MLLRLEHGNGMDLIVPWFGSCGVEGDPHLLGASEMTSIKVGLRLRLRMELGNQHLSRVREMTNIEVRSRLEWGWGWNWAAGVEKILSLSKPEKRELYCMGDS